MQLCWLVYVIRCAILKMASLSAISTWSEAKRQISIMPSFFHSKQCNCEPTDVGISVSIHNICTEEVPLQSLQWISVPVADLHKSQNCYKDKRISFIHCSIPSSPYCGLTAESARESHGLSTSTTLKYTSFVWCKKSHQSSKCCCSDEEQCFIHVQQAQLEFAQDCGSLCEFILLFVVNQVHWRMSSRLVHMLLHPLLPLMNLHRRMLLGSHTL